MSADRSRTRQILVAAGWLAIIALARCLPSQDWRPGGEPILPEKVVPSGPKTVAPQTRFTIELDSQLGSAITRPPESFRAVITTPIDATDGTTAIDAGRVLTGRVVAIERPPNASIYLAFDSIESPWGNVDVEATLDDVQSLPGVAIGQRTDRYDAVVRALPAVPLLTSQEAAPSSDVILPAHSNLHLLLTAPLLARPPSTSEDGG